MAVDKMSITFEPGLGDEIRAAAAADGESVSAWLAEAARERLRQLALSHTLDELLRDEGLSTDDLAAADDLLAASFWTTPAPKSPRERKKSST